MPKYRVHLFPIVRVTVEDVAADNPQAAFDAAFDAVDFISLFYQEHPDEQPHPGRGYISSVGFHDGDDGAIVDEEGGDSVDFDGRFAGHADMLRVLTELCSTFECVEKFPGVQAAIAKASGAETNASPPRVLITVRGGVADFAADPGVNVCLVDYDNLEADMDEAEFKRGEADVLADAIPREFADLVEGGAV